MNDLIGERDPLAAYRSIRHPEPIRVSPAASVLAGTISGAELAAELECSTRTIIRFERQGMPYIAVGKLRRYRTEAIKEWLIAHERKPEPPRRGRPRKSA